MTAKSKVVSVRATLDDIALCEQAAAQKGQRISVWMRDTLREVALEQVYGGEEDKGFPSTPGETALLRAVLVILQTVGADTPDKVKRQYAEKAARQIVKIKAEE